MILKRGDFAGDWRLERAIDDRLSAQEGALDGQARFLPVEGSGLRYSECGLLRIGNAAPLEARRRYHWQFSAGEVEVRFDDGRPFHSFVPGGRRPGTPHLCGEDLYRVVYDFTRFPDWQSIWIVTGPRKDYTMTTRYRRT